MSSQDQKPLKKAKPELDDSDDGMSLGALLQEKRKKLLNVGSKLLSKPKKEELLGVDGLGKSPKIDSGSAPKGSKVKKEERFNSVNDDFDEKPAKKSSAAKRDTELESLKKERKQKKVYDLPGQKRDPPEERDPLRIFYESLHKQLPHSEMAQFWMMESGLLSKEEAKEVFEKKQKKAPLQKLSSPMKTVSAVKSVTKTAVVKKTVQSSPLSSNRTTKVDSKVVMKSSKKRKSKDDSSEDDSDDDFFISQSIKKKARAA
ncbi:golgin subfamily A member 6-like protein 22 [Cucumis melo var. makuwa]|uniref:Golgin subfamily A member 6-like protein 22 n=1 Tax=Cucumis melo var. makuwa TaxID=1194695 RepID=A0A5A7V6S5_CUCMM|nr:golgin subfamily A member 6-like protein 22 [Cucumis melo var. makuwa]